MFSGTQADFIQGLMGVSMMLPSITFAKTDKIVNRKRNP